MPEFENIVFKSIPDSFELLEGESADISTISSSKPDKVGDLVVPQGGDWSIFTKNGSPVHLAHKCIQVGRALWTKIVGNKIVAKTQYSKDPHDPGSKVFPMIQKGLLRGKSITLHPEEVLDPTLEQKSQGIKRVISKWTALEYSVCSNPINEDAEIIAISKAFDISPEIQTLASEWLKEYEASLRRANIPEIVSRTLRKMKGQID